jgi:predicted nucleic acid-binding protein
MESAVLVDSCVFITLLKQRRDPAAELMERLQLEDIVTCGMVRLEVVRGVSIPKVKQAMEGFFDVMRNVITDNKLWEEATELAWRLQRNGMNLPAQDILIATCALRADVAVLTYDKHFKAIPGLRIYGSLDELR